MILLGGMEQSTSMNHGHDIRMTELLGTLQQMSCVCLAVVKSIIKNKQSLIPMSLNNQSIINFLNVLFAPLEAPKYICCVLASFFFFSCNLLFLSSFLGLNRVEDYKVQHQKHTIGKLSIWKCIWMWWLLSKFGPLLLRFLWMWSWLVDCQQQAQMDHSFCMQSILNSISM